MAELALRGYNVAIPEIDIGDDVFVLNDSTKQAVRIQVKTRKGKPGCCWHLCVFPVKCDHLEKQIGEDHYYVFVGRCGDRWRYVIVPTTKLTWLTHERRPRLGSMRGDESEVQIPIYFRQDGKAKTHIGAKAINLTKYQKWSLGIGKV
jgi:hypothetical protein